MRYELKFLIIFEERPAIIINLPLTSIIGLS